jgi:hypothetical protein
MFTEGIARGFIPPASRLDCNVMIRTNLLNLNLLLLALANSES